MARKASSKKSARKKSTTAKRSTAKRSTAKRSTSKKKTTAKRSPVKTVTGTVEAVASKAKKATTGAKKSAKKATTGAKKLGTLMEVAGAVLATGATLAEQALNRRDAKGGSSTRKKRSSS